jgi:hypothetical protein
MPIKSADVNRIYTMSTGEVAEVHHVWNGADAAQWVRCTFTDPNTLEEREEKLPMTLFCQMAERDITPGFSAFRD